MAIGFILLALALVEVTVGLIMLLRYERSHATTFYGCMALAVAMYVGANGFGFIDRIVSPSIAESFAWLGGILLSTFFLAFSFTFPITKRTAREILPWVIWPLLVFIPSILFTDLVIVHHPIQAFGINYSAKPGPLMWLWVITFGWYLAWGILNLTLSYRLSSGYYRWFIRILLVGVVISLVAGIFFDIYQPLTNQARVPYIGSLCSSVWVIMTGYLMLKK